MIFALTNVAPDKWVNKQKVETQETKATGDKTHEYHFEDLPEDLLFGIADKLQQGEYNRIQKEKGVIEDGTDSKE